MGLFEPMQMNEIYFYSVTVIAACECPSPSSLCISLSLHISLCLRVYVPKKKQWPSNWSCSTSGTSWTIARAATPNRMRSFCSTRTPRRPSKVGYRRWAITAIIILSIRLANIRRPIVVQPVPSCIRRTNGIGNCVLCPPRGVRSHNLYLHRHTYTHTNSHMPIFWNNATQYKPTHHHTPSSPSLQPK